MANGLGGDHLRIKQGVPREMAMEDTAMPVRPIHHGRHTKSVRRKLCSRGHQAYFPRFTAHIAHMERVVITHALYSPAPPHLSIGKPVNWSDRLNFAQKYYPDDAANPSLRKNWKTPVSADPSYAQQLTLISQNFRHQILCLHTVADFDMDNGELSWALSHH
jgi:hypothetical protein